MTTCGWTKGPWHVRNNGPHCNNPEVTNYNIAWSEDGELVAEHVYEYADARLIASAPQIYEALADAPDIMAMQPEEFYIAYTAWLAKARTALAAARGEG